MKISLWILVVLFSLFILLAACYGFYLVGGIGMIVFVPIITGVVIFLLKKLGVIK